MQKQLSQKQQPDDENTKNAERSCQDRLIVSPENIFYQIFKGFIVMLCILSSLMYAFFAAFRMDVEGEVSVYSPAEIKNFNRFQAIVECMFLIDMVIEFFLEYVDESTTLKVRDISMISVRYLRGEFIYDIFPLIPFNWIFQFKHSRLLFLVKCSRLMETF